MQPPNLKAPIYLYGPRCENCVSYKKRFCAKFAVDVSPNQVCDDWLKNPTWPMKVY